MSFSSFISAEKTSDLLSLYNEALRHDALLSAATLQNKATQELIDQGPISFITKYICPGQLY
jgi:cyclopropane fatty-acyl-phospholipid synthase-like methyltransferase